MVNLLTEKDRIGLKKERKFRVINIALIIFSLSFGACVIALAPRMFLVFIEHRGVSKQLDDLKNKPASIDYKNLESSVSLTKKQIDSAKKNLEGRSYLSKILPELLNGKPRGISITNISFSKGEKENTLYISGTADSREDLRQFSAILKSNMTFSGVDVPVSNFAKSTENDFSITLKLSSTYGQ